MFRIRKSKTFEMAHVLGSSYSKECQQVHGHSYTMEIIIEAKELNKDGMVIDFKRLREILMPIVDCFDHKLVMYGTQENLGSLTTWLTFNPTAENMTAWIWNKINGQIKSEVPTATRLVVRLHETATGWAEYDEEL